MKPLYPTALSLLLTALAQPAPAQIISPPPPAPSIPAPQVAKIQAVLITGNVTFDDTVGKRFFTPPGYDSGTEFFQDSSGERPLALGTIFSGGDNFTVGAGPSQAGLAFSNGNFLLASANTKFSIITFAQAPYNATIPGTFLHLASPDPSKSRTLLALSSGTLLVEVKALNLDIGSQTSVDTPLSSFDVCGAHTLLRVSISQPTGPKHAISVTVDCLKGAIIGLLINKTGVPVAHMPNYLLTEGQEYIVTGSDSPNDSTDPVITSPRTLSPAEITQILSPFLPAKTAALAH